MVASMLAEGLRERSDIVAKLRHNPIFVVELKVPSAFRAGKWQIAPSLVQNYREWSDAASDSHGSLAASNRDGSPAISAFCAVQQLYGYLHKLNLNFGVISSLDLTYFVKRKGLELSIYEPIKWDSGNLIVAIDFLIHLVAQATASHVGSASRPDSMGDGHHDNTQGRDSKDDGGGRGGATTTKSHDMAGHQGFSWLAGDRCREFVFVHECYHRRRMEWIHCSRHLQGSPCCSQTCACTFRPCRGEHSLLRREARRVFDSVTLDSEDCKREQAQLQEIIDKCYF